MCSNNQRMTVTARQRGALLPMAIFIIVILSFVGLAVVKILNSADKATVSEVQGARALFAARSGAEIFLTDHLFVDDEAIDTNGVCLGRDESAAEQPPSTNLASPLDEPYAFSVPGLAGCTATIYCNKATPEGFAVTHYRIVSQGECGDGKYSRVLTLEVSEEIDATP